ncbi:MAG: hypothetical protein H6879_00215 [Rhodobiaceae bacterium]|nr:hypothetical protein [Rhodobiaceae bacterium]
MLTTEQVAGRISGAAPIVAATGTDGEVPCSVGGEQAVGAEAPKRLAQFILSHSVTPKASPGFSVLGTIGGSDQKGLGRRALRLLRRPAARGVPRQAGRTPVSVDDETSAGLGRRATTSRRRRLSPYLIEAGLRRQVVIPIMVDGLEVPDDRADFRTSSATMESA